MKTKTIHDILVGLCICGATAMTMPSCSDIGENERLVYVEPVIPIDTTSADTVHADSIYDAPVGIVGRRLLIEDFTGQHCPNCPTATNIIHEFQKAFGSLVVPVAIHSLPLGVMEPEGLATELGNTYYRYWNMKQQPMGLLSRMDGGTGKVMNPVSDWNALMVQYILGIETPLDIRVKARLGDDGQTAEIDVKVICTRDGQSVSGQLQVWMTEDSVVAEQDSLNGVRLTDYVHNHVLRATVNGDWGENVSLTDAGDQKELHYTMPLKTAWRPERLAVVAFVYNDQEVVQVVRRELAIDKQ